MRPMLYAARLGLGRGVREFRQTLTAPEEIGFQIFFAVVFLIVVFFQRNTMIEGSEMSVAMATLPSLVGLQIAFGGIMSAAGALTIDRGDGTLLRSKAIPNGMVGYFVSRIVGAALGTLLSMLVILLPGLVILPELTDVSLLHWLVLILIGIVGLLATLPTGAIIGSMTKSPNGLFLYVMLPVMLVTGISGVFYPITALPDWLQWVAQLFPIYWLGHAVRWVFLSDAGAAAEIAGAWRLQWAAVVLGAWAIAGFLIAPGVLRRMARRESGSVVAERRQEAMQRMA